MADVATAMSGLSTRYYAAYRNQAMSAIAAIMRDASAAGTTAAPPMPAIEPTGLATLDKTVAIIARFCGRIAVLNAEVQKDIASYEADKFMETSRLTTAAGLSQSRLALDKADARMERYLADVAAELAAYRVEVAALIPDPAARENLDRQMAPSYAMMVRLGEAQRAMFVAVGRILDFAQSRLGRLGVQNGKLAYRNEMDMEPLRDLMAQLQKKVAEAKQVADDGRLLSDGAIKTFSGGG
jgi:hypothetical protein